MKSKRKLDPKAIKQFFIDHTEKIVIGVVGLLFLYFTYSAVMLQANDSYKKEPKNLADAVQAAERTMVAGPKSKTPVTEAPIPPYAKHIERFKEPKDIKDYPPEVWETTVLAQRNARGTPAVIPVEELRAVAGRGALSSKDGNAGTVGQRWVVVVGLVPYGKQLDEYKRRFASAGLLGDHDTPEYVGFLVQRAEVMPGAAGEPNWEKATTVCYSGYLNRQLERWSGMAAEIVDPRSTWPSLTSPLPPRAIGEWGDEAAHAGEIKVVPPEERDQTQGGGQAGPGPAVRPGQFGDHRGRIGGGVLRGGGAMPGMPRGGADQGGDEIFDKPPDAAKDDAAKSKAADEAAQTPPYFLLRYFDFDVEPGKQYAYRVVPLLKNPNEGLPESVLSEPRQKDQRFLGIALGKDRPDASGKVADWKIDPYWSNSCQTTKLPGDTRVIAGAVQPPKTPSPTEVTGEVRILRWDETTGVNKSAHPDGQYRGAVLNFDATDVVTPPDERPAREEMKTNNILADMTGGEALMPRVRDSIHGPGAMIFLDEYGNLVISDEMSQTKEWINETKMPERPSTDGGRRGQSPERRPPRMRGERGGPPRGGLTPSPDSSLPDMAPHGGR